MSLTSAACTFRTGQATFVALAGPPGSASIVVDSSGWAVDFRRGTSGIAWQWGSRTYAVDPIIDELESGIADMNGTTAVNGFGFGLYIIPDGPVKYHLFTVRHYVIWFILSALCICAVIRILKDRQAGLSGIRTRSTR